MSYSDLNSIVLQKDAADSAAEVHGIAVAMLCLDKNTLATYLEIISRADVLFGKIMKTQNWRLLRYLNETLIELYQKDDRIRYSQYNLSWPLLNRIRWDGRKIKSLTLLFAQKLHLSSSSFSVIGFPFVLFCLKNKKLHLELEETFGDILEKEMELIK